MLKSLWTPEVSHEVKNVRLQSMKTLDLTSLYVKLLFVYFCGHNELVLCWAANKNQLWSPLAQTPLPLFSIQKLAVARACSCMLIHLILTNPDGHLSISLPYVETPIRARIWPVFTHGLLGCQAPPTGFHGGSSGRDTLQKDTRVTEESIFIFHFQIPPKSPCDSQIISLIYKWLQEHLHWKGEIYQWTSRTDEYW